MNKLTKKAIRSGRTDGPTLIIGKLRFYMGVFVLVYLFSKLVPKKLEKNTLLLCINIVLYYDRSG